MKQPCQKWQGCWFYGSRKDAGGMHREEGMPDSIRRNRNRCRDAGNRRKKAAEYRGEQDKETRGAKDPRTRRRKPAFNAGE